MPLLEGYNRLEITEELIKKATPNDTRLCPIGQAFMAMGCEDIFVQPNRVIVWSGDDVFTWEIEPDAADIIRHYDLTGQMQPLTLYFNQGQLEIGLSGDKKTCSAEYCKNKIPVESGFHKCDHHIALDSGYWKERS